MGQVIHIFGLIAFAWSLPLFVMLAGSESFFVSYGFGPRSMVVFALAIGLVFPAIAARVVLRARRTHAKLDEPLAAVSLALLFALGLLPTMKSLSWLPGPIIIALSIAAGVIAARMYFRSATLRAALTVLAALAPLYVIGFLSQSSIVFPDKIDEQRYTLSTFDQSRPPVVLIIYDQLSLQAILDEDKLINRKTFPNFARLADRSTWFRNASTVAEKTSHSVPAILTGRYAGGDPDRAATHANYPVNAFTLFDEMGYANVASERLTQLCPPGLNIVDRSNQSFSSAVRIFATDLLIVSGHLYAPPDIALYFPSLESKVSNFAHLSPRRKGGIESSDAQYSDFFLQRHAAFVETLKNVPGRFHMAHIMLPHHPYRMLPSAKLYIEDRLFRDNYILYQENWPADPYHAARDMQRYYNQAATADRLLGQLIDRLEDTGLYEDAYIVVTADHGVSFQPEFGMRLAVREGESKIADFTNAMDIVKTATFIKVPHQQDARIVDDPFQLIDILPTILERIGGPLDQNLFDGRAMLAPDPPELSNYRLFSFKNASFVDHTLDITDDRYETASKFQIMDFDHSFALREPFYEELHGEDFVVPAARDAAPYRAKLHRAKAYEDVKLNTNFVPALIRAKIDADEAPALKTSILITVNGKFGAVTRTFTRKPIEEKKPSENTRSILNAFVRKQDSWIAVVVDEALFQEGRNDIALYEIKRDPSGEPMSRQIHLR